MPGFLSGRQLEPNAIEDARLRRLAAGLPLIDLTDSNPTSCGFIFPPEVLCTAAQRYLMSRRYNPDPRGDCEARRAISEYYKTRTPALDIDAANIFITASTSESYRLLFSLLCDPGDNVLVSHVTYPLYDLFAEDRGILLKQYLLNEETDWQATPDSIRCSIDDRTRAILFVSPHNPTGMVCFRPLPEVRETNLPLVSDEVFAEFVRSGGSAPPLGAIYPELPVFHLNGVSKMFALPDLKLGWIALNEKAAERYGERLAHLNDAFLSCSPLVQAMFPELFASGGEFRRGMLAAVRSRTALALSELRRSSKLHLHAPQGGAFLLARLLHDVDEDELILKLLEAGVLVHPGYYYGLEDGPFIMLSTLPSEERLRQGLSIIVRFLDSL